jgi:Icc-related predicted phosphoesterase
MASTKKESGKTRIAAVGDIHVRETDGGKWKDYFKEVSEQADVLLLCGDLTDTGKVAEAEVLVEELRACTIPVLAVLGNHDHDHDQVDALLQTFAKSNLQILDGDFVVVENVGFAGVKGYGGGFDQYMLGLFGEQLNKDFVQEAVTESLKLDGALAHLDSHEEDIQKVVLLHYAPIKATVEGEPEAIHPFLGCSRLEEPLNRRKVTAAFHGHAHIGSLEGKTNTGVMVYNVSKPLLLKNGYKMPVFVLEI